MSQFFSKRFSKMKPYVPGEQPQDMSYIKLNTNESPFLPSPKVLKAVNSEEVSKLQLYPDPENKCLVKAIADFYQLEPEQVMAANGSDEILGYAFLAFCDSQKAVCFPDISYGFYKVYAELYGIDVLTVPVKNDLSVDYRDYLACGRTMVIANPNAPTGLCLPPIQIEEILKANPGDLLILDEAYVDFGGATCLPLLQKYDNLLIIRTFSKSRSLAGARIGFALSSAAIIEDLKKMKFSFSPYSINRLSLAAGVAAMEDKEYFERCAQKIILTREKIKASLINMGFTVTDSCTNFIFAKHTRFSGQELYQQLKEEGILVRHFKQEKIDRYVRITVGLPEEMDKLLAALEEIIEEN